MEINEEKTDVSIAGFNFRLIFKITQQINYNKKQSILSFIKYFIIKKAKGKIDYYLEINETDEPVIRKGDMSPRAKNNIFVRLFYIHSKKRRIYTSFNISLYEFELILKILLFSLLEKHHSFMMHLSAVAYKNRGYLFFGPSGSGKSTIAKLLKKKAIPLCDDIGYIKKEKKGYYIYQSPHNEKNEYSKSSKGYLIKNMYFINQSHSLKLEKIESINNKIIIKRVTSQIFINKDMKKILHFIKCSQKQFYNLFFPKNGNNIAQKILNG